MSRDEYTDITLNLSEYEASVVTGALAEYAERWEEGEAHTANYLRDLLMGQLPAEWRGDWVES